MRRLRRVIWYWALSFFVASCGFPMQQEADEILRLGLSALSGKDQFAFQGIHQSVTVGLPPDSEVRFEGVVNQHHKVYLRFVQNGNKRPVANQSVSNGQWISLNEKQPSPYREFNPLAHISDLKQLKKEVENAPNKEISGAQKVRVILDEGALKKRMIGKLGLDVEAYFSQKMAGAQGNRGLGERELSIIRRELEEKTKNWKEQLEEIKGTLRVQGEYLLWIDRTSKLPVRMDTITVFRYESGGEEREEKFIHSYRFKDYDRVTVEIAE